jgi:hypothetical protein
VKSAEIRVSAPSRAVTHGILPDAEHGTSLSWMSTTTLVHFAVFGAGAVLGAGIASQVNKNWRVQPSVPLPPAPVVEKLPSTRDDLGPVLKYSSPGG